MGHISLPVPVVNIALFKILATNLSKLLGIATKKLEDIIYLRSYVVVDNGLTSLLKKKQILEKNLDSHLIDAILQEVIQEKLLLNEEILTKKKELNELIDQARHEISQLEVSGNSEKVNKIKETIVASEKKLK